MIFKTLNIDSSSPNNHLTKDCLLLVEGTDEARVFEGLLKHHGLENEVLILNYEGKDKLGMQLSVIKTFTNYPKVKVIGVTGDADKNAPDAFVNIKAILEKNGYLAPNRPNEVISGSGLAIGIFIIPGGDQGGALEDLLLKSVQNNKGFECVDQFLDCFQRETQKKIKNISKAKVQAFLSGQEISKRSPGDATDVGYWDFSHSVWEPFSNFVKLLVDSRT